MAAVVFAIDSLLGGGAERVVLTLAEGFVRKGYDCHILTFQAGLDYSLIPGIQVHLIDERPYMNLGSKRFAQLARLVDLELDKIQQDGTEILGVISNLTFTDRVLQYSRFPRIIFCIHSTLSGYWKINQGNWFQRFKRLRKLRKLYGGKHLVTVSQGAEADLRNLGVRAASLRTIYNPFNIEEIRKQAEAPISPDLQGDYMVCVGRFKPVKRHDRLIRVFAQAGVPLKLLLLGKGTEEQEQAVREQVRKHRLEDQVIFQGFTSNPYPYIRHAKALLLTSDFEGLPTVVVEALICGTPVVSTDCTSGPREILTGDQARFLVPLEDEALFARKIREVLESPPRMEDLNLERFERDQAVLAYERVLRSLC